MLSKKRARIRIKKNIGYSRPHKSDGKSVACAIEIAHENIFKPNKICEIIKQLSH